MKFVSRQATGGQRGNQCARTGQRLDAKACRNRSPHDAFTGIANPRAAGVCNQRDFLAVSQTLEDLLTPLSLVELEIAEEGF